jgi:hypothetical protein
LVGALLKPDLNAVVEHCVVHANRTVLVHTLSEETA